MTPPVHPNQYQQSHQSSFLSTCLLFFIFLSSFLTFRSALQSSLRNLPPNSLFPNSSICATGLIFFPFTLYTYPRLATSVATSSGCCCWVDDEPSDVRDTTSPVNSFLLRRDSIWLLRRQSPFWILNLASPPVWTKLVSFRNVWRSMSGVCSDDDDDDNDNDEEEDDSEGDGAWNVVVTLVVVVVGSTRGRRNGRFVAKEDTAEHWRIYRIATRRRAGGGGLFDMLLELY